MLWKYPKSRKFYGADRSQYRRDLSCLSFAISITFMVYGSHAIHQMFLQLSKNMSSLIFNDMRVDLVGSTSHWPLIWHNLRSIRAWMLIIFIDLSAIWLFIHTLNGNQDNSCPRQLVHRITHAQNNSCPRLLIAKPRQLVPRSTRTLPIGYHKTTEDNGKVIGAHSLPKPDNLRRRAKTIREKRRP